jgi:small subunit ribosomal protein S3
LGHKVNPIGFRLGVVKGWQSRWYAERDYKDLLAEDFKLRKLILKELANASISKIEIERAAANQVTIIIHTAKPGIVIGKSGEKVDRLRATLEKETRKRVKLNIMEIRQPELDAYLVGRSIAEQLEKRVSFRRAMKQAVQRTMRANAKGIRIVCGGRLGGAEIARVEKEIEGKIPLQTLRADIDYGLAEAHTTFGVIGIKVWIYKGDVLPTKRREAMEGAAEAASPFTSERSEGGERRSDRRPPRGDRGQGERSPRGERPQGERAPRGERSDRGYVARAPRGDRPQGERTGTERAPRGERPQGERPPRGDRPQGERAPRPPRPQGERPARAPRAEKPAEEQPATQAAQAVEAPQPQPQPQVEPETQVVPTPAPEPETQAPAAPETSASESE